MYNRKIAKWLQTGLLMLLAMAMMTAGAQAQAESTEVAIAVLKGPTGMGAAHLMDRNDHGETENAYQFTIAGSPDLITGQLITGELDMAALPTNAIAMLYAKTEGAVQVLAVNTLGVLYLLERGDAVQSIEDLQDKTVVSAGLGTTTEAVANRLFPQDVTVDYVSEHSEAIALALAGRYDLVLLPEPFVTSLLGQGADFAIAIDLTAEWKAATNAELPMGGIAVRRAFLQERPEAVEAFLREYAQSVEYANNNPKEAAALIESYDIMAAAVAEQAIPRANMVCLVGEPMKTALEAFYAVLEVDNPALIGSALPQEDFYIDLGTVD